MSTIGERVQLVRKSDKVHMTMEEFGEKLGVQKSAVSKIEKSLVNLTEQMKLSICREFGVNQEWLETGEGEMFVETSFPELQDLKERYSLDEDAVLMIEKFVTLSEDKRKAVIEYVRSVAISMGIAVPETAKKKAVSPASEDDPADSEAKALHEELDRQIALEKGIMEKSEVS